MADVNDQTDQYSEQRPFVMGDDDGSPARLVIALGYGNGLRKGQVRWVVGDRVDQALNERLVAPVATSVPAIIIPVVAVPEPPPVDIPEPFPEGPQPEPDVPEIRRVDDMRASLEVPDGGTYDLDAEPVKRRPGRPRKETAV